jgi:hypothetical protein
MLNNAVGYREASVGDAWTGMSRHNEKARRAFADAMMAMPFMGKDAFKYLSQAEALWKTGASVAKQTIVVRSVIVPAANMASNVLQLMTVGVSVRDMAKGFPEKLVEIEQHLKNLDRAVRIKALMARHHRDPDQRRSMPASRPRGTPTTGT